METFKLFSTSALLLGALLIFGQCLADHPDKAHRPKGKPESSLSGVDINSREHHALQNDDGIYIEPIASILETLGVPAKVITKNDCERDYLWIKEGVRTSVGTGCIPQQISGKIVSRGHGAYSVDVWGKNASGILGVTGRGLALGDLWARVKQIYGTRGQFDRYTTGTGTQDTHGFKYYYNARYQWGDAVLLTIDADRQGNVVHMQLMGDLE